MKIRIKISILSIVIILSILTVACGENNSSSTKESNIESTYSNETSNSKIAETSVKEIQSLKEAQTESEAEVAKKETQAPTQAPQKTVDNTAKPQTSTIAPTQAPQKTVDNTAKSVQNVTQAPAQAPTQAPAKTPTTSNKLPEGYPQNGYWEGVKLQGGYDGYFTSPGHDKPRGHMIKYGWVENEGYPRLYYVDFQNGDHYNSKTGEYLSNAWELGLYGDVFN